MQQSHQGFSSVAMKVKEKKSRWGGQLRNYLHNLKKKKKSQSCSWRGATKGSLSGQRQGRNTICRHGRPPPPPPPHPASWADYDSGAGWAGCHAIASSHSSVDDCCGWLLPFARGGRDGTKLKLLSLWRPCEIQESAPLFASFECFLYHCK